VIVKDRNINISNSENNSTVTNNVGNSLIGENCFNLSNFLNNECVNIYICDVVPIDITSFLVKEMQTLLI